MQGAVGRTLAGKASPQRLLRYPARLTAPLLVGDSLMFLLSTIFAASILTRMGHVPIDPLNALESTVASGSICIAVFAYAGFYRRSLAVTWHDEYYWVAAVSMLAILPQLVLYTLMPQISTSRLLLITTIPINVAVVGTFRAVLRRWSDRLGRLRPKIAVVGDPHEIQVAANRVGSTGDLDVFLIPVADWSEQSSWSPKELHIRQERWFWCARQWNVDCLVFARVPAAHSLRRIVAEAARQRVQIAFATRELVSGLRDFEVEYVNGEPLIVPALPRGCHPSTAVSKAIFDLVFALLLLAVLWPVMLIAALAILIESGRPVLFFQERVGQDGATFHILKFRSMHWDAEKTTGAVWAQPQDSRVTRVGRFLRRTSLDELPQIFNVLRGEMSVVGPRPERPAFVERFSDAIDRYDERHLMRPGITGLSHVYMSRDVDPSAIGQRLEYDLFYIENWSPMMDLSIVFKTGCEFLLHRIAA
jgi:exopolysaccharide biosynthesis polyprenyl glycosylphosphotransferase